MEGTPRGQGRRVEEREASTATFSSQRIGGSVDGLRLCHGGLGHGAGAENRRF